MILVIQYNVVVQSWTCRQQRCSGNQCGARPTV